MCDQEIPCHGPGLWSGLEWLVQSHVARRTALAGSASTVYRLLTLRLKALKVSGLSLLNPGTFIDGALYCGLKR